MSLVDKSPILKLLRLRHNQANELVFFQNWTESDRLFDELII